MLKTLKKLLAATFITAVASTSAFAAEDAAGVAQGVQDTIQSTKDAIAAINNGKTADEVLPLIRKIRQNAKEITGDNFGASLDKGSDVVLTARRETKAHNLTGALDALNKALVIYEKEVLPKVH